MPNTEKLQKETYLKMIENSVGTRLFNSAFVKFKNDEKPTDICNDGEYSCAFFVSGILTILKYLDTPVATVKSLVEKLIKKGWQKIESDQIKNGDIVIWEELTFEDNSKNEHAGFVLNKDEAISTSYKEKMVIKHHLTFGVKQDGTPKRKIEILLRLPE